MITCAEAVRQLWEYLDDGLDTRNRRDVSDHLALCRRCCGEAEFTAALQDMLRASAGPALPWEVERRFLDFLHGLEQEPS